VRVDGDKGVPRWRLVTFRAIAAAPILSGCHHRAQIQFGNDNDALFIRQRKPPRVPRRGGQFQSHPCAGATCAICAAFSSVGNRPFGVSRLIKSGRSRQQVFPSHVGLPAQHVKRIAAKRVGPFGCKCIVKRAVLSGGSAERACDAPRLLLRSVSTVDRGRRKSGPRRGWCSS
jgi:hypothetical protein